MRKSDNIILIGFMGSGKSSVGKLLSKKLSYRFNDTDKMIEDREEIPIKEIFSRYGEEFFRDTETTLLLSLEDTLEETVLSTGGGIVVRDRNVELLHRMGQIIYLKASSGTIIKRLTGDTTRPLLKGENLKDKVEKLLTDRMQIYENAADIIINTDNKSVRDIVNEISGYLNPGTNLD